jgi:septal ring factor EnvC (AmiA/AmiB activator)
MTPELEAQLRDVVARKAEVSRLGVELAARRTEIDQIGKDQERVRENMRALKGSPEERQLLQRYVKQLDEQETRIAALRAEVQTLTGQLDKARADLSQAIEAIK